MDLIETMRRWMRANGDDPLLCYRDTWCSREQFAAAARAIDAHLTGAGIGARTPIGIFMRNRPGVVAALAAVLATERPVMVLNPFMPDDTVGTDILALRPAAVLADAEDWTRSAVNGAVAAIGALGLRVDVATNPADSATEQVPRRRDAEHAVLDGGVAILMPTSGTTGPPKRIPLQYREIEQALAGAQEHYMAGSARAGSVRGGGVQIISLPSTNISGLWAIITALSGGGRCLLQDKFEPTAWSEAVAEYKPRSVSLPPAALRMVLDADIEPAKLASLKAVWAGAAPTGADLAAQFEATYGCPVLLSYGATEFTGGITGWSLKDWQAWKDTKRGSVGRPHPGVEISVVDQATGDLLEPGEPGILQVRSAQAAGGDSNWVRTNDLGSVDDDGFVWIHGRADDMINRGGFKIFPVELEDCLESHPRVREAVAFGIADQRLGEVPVAVVVTTGLVTAEDLIAWTRSRMPGYKVPVRVQITDSIPRNSAMKILRQQVREEFETAMAATQ
ncbi:fatty acid--CoA ligase family protein [Mycobacterium sp. CVI_P3]|uniref:Fatty acid--CoA ligase family protein n=1 Tax=Mycobacterium pinniadriaticum TaxID=2994102 RepID=A0ABT3SC10_9MYCO|nr:fatty acid--CoA ligase family protein [Mycobacterium pinniadriaticum]MCX2930622.1 fatty acid--CoA ligase family protein [Mycobacterium pinniadriaticum]MCX2937046.1 fatty acid--CoA ligase family protein [Mycobacterium pinniadriaticum]